MSKNKEVKAFWMGSLGASVAGICGTEGFVSVETLIIEDANDVLVS